MFIFLILFATGVSSFAQSIASIKPNSEFVFQGRTGQVKRIATEISDYSYKFKNRADKEVETIYGIIDINFGENQSLPTSERKKVEESNPLKVGNVLRFYYNGDSGSGVWTRAVNLEVKSEGALAFNGHTYEIKYLEGNVAATKTYDFGFKCWYAPALKSCIKAETDTYSQRNPTSNGKNYIELIEINER